MKKVMSFALVAISIFILGISCSGSGKKDQEKQSLHLGVMSSMDYLPLAVAQREGYFDKIGVDVTLQKFYSANERDAAFQSLNIDGTVIDFTGAVLQKAGGIDLKLTSKCDAPFYIVAGVQTGINDLQGLKAKQVAVSQNTVIDFIVDMALKSVNLTDADIKKVEINKIPLRFEMLRNNKIDATGLPNPFALMAQGAGDKILTSNDSLGFAITGIMFHSKAMEAKGQLISQMYEGYNLGVDYLNSHSAKDVEDILIKELGFPADIIPTVKLPQYTHAQLPTDKDIQATVNWLKGKNLIKADFELSTLLDSQFLPE